MQSGEAADLAIFIVSCCLLVGYWVFYFTTESFTIPIIRKKFINLYAMNRKSRRQWIEVLQDEPKEGINAVQTVRNQVLAVSILAAATAPLISTLLNLITDAAKLDQIQEYSTIDPITAGTALMSPAVRLAIALGVLLLAVMAYAQSVRLSVHVGYVIRVVSSDPQRHATLSKRLKAIQLRSSLYFAVGLRLFFAFGPFILYILGPTALLIAAVLDVAAQFLFDCVPAGEEYEAVEVDEEKEATSGALTQMAAAS